jgi:hypothetical protein
MIFRGSAGAVAQWIVSMVICGGAVLVGLKVVCFVLNNTVLEWFDAWRAGRGGSR